MQVQTQHGIVSSIMMEPFSGMPEAFALRSRLLDVARQQTAIHPERCIEVFDEVLVTFGSMEESIDFLSRVIDLARSDLNNPGSPVELRCGLCWGEFFLHTDQIYGPAVNLATQLSFQSRKNEILVGGMNCERVQQALSSRHHLECFIRDENKHLVSIGLSTADDTITRINHQKLVLSSEVFCRSYKQQRLLVLSIGRSPECDLQLEYDHISRQHATLTLKQDQLYLEDHSANGTYLYSEDQEYYLKHETVALGERGELSFGIKAEDHPSLIVSFHFQNDGEETGEFKAVGIPARP